MQQQHAGWVLPHGWKQHANDSPQKREGPAVMGPPASQQAAGPSLHRTSSTGSWLHAVALDLAGSTEPCGLTSCAEQPAATAAHPSGPLLDQAAAAAGGAGVMAEPLLSLGSGDILGLLDELQAEAAGVAAAPLAAHTVAQQVRRWQSGWFGVAFWGTA
jgi:hypothetical protein